MKCIKVVLHPLINFVTNFAFFSKNNYTLVTKVMYITGARNPITSLKFQWFKTSGSLYMLRNEVHSSSSFLIINNEPLVLSHCNSSVVTGFLAPIIYITFVTSVLIIFWEKCKNSHKFIKGCSTPLMSLINDMFCNWY